MEQSATTTKKAKKPTFTLTTTVVVAAFGYWLANGNPTQQVGKLLKMCRDGMAGGEGVDKFDAVRGTDIVSLLYHESYLQ